jgi:hypothetical protein
MMMLKIQWLNRPSPFLLFSWNNNSIGKS